MVIHDGIFSQIYTGELSDQKERYSTLIEKFKKKFGEKDYHVFSVPGRTELSGNHTDHNHGRVIAAAINLDSVAVASGNGTNNIIVHSDGFDNAFDVDLGKLKKIDGEAGTTNSLVRGIAARLKDLGYKTGGFNAFITSDVLIGSGLSSSASIEILIGTIFNHLYNDGRIDPVVLAQTGQYAENEYFGKPCGLMDQMACAIGGIIGIDFRDPAKPEYEKIEIDFSGLGCSIFIINTGGSHADLTDEYAAIPAEMKSVANHFGVETCRDIPPGKFLPEVPKLRESVNDRAVLRAYHFIHENERVLKQLKSLRNKELAGFLKLAGESGDSSFKWLQNIYSPKNYKYQPVSLALAMSESFINEKGSGAARIHGGGFAGTIQVFIKNEHADEFTNYMSSLFGKDNVKKLSIRNQGAVRVI